MTREERVDAIRPLYADNLSAREIAIELGTTRNAIIGYLDRSFKETRRPPGRPRQARAATPRAPRAPRVAAPRTPAPKVAKPATDLPRYVAKPVPWLAAIEKRDTCRFIEGDPLAQPIDELTICGHPRDGESPYCAWHRKIAYQPARVREAA